MHSEQFHLPKVSDSEVEVDVSNSEQFHLLPNKVSKVGPAGSCCSMLSAAERENHTQFYSNMLIYNVKKTERLFKVRKLNIEII